MDEHAAVFPGDTAYSQAVHLSLTSNCPASVHSITLSPHTGTHAVQNLPPRVLLRTTTARQDWAPFTELLNRY